MNTTISNNLNIDLGIAYTYISPTIMGITLITNIVNIIILSRRKLRSSPCTYYFLALTTATIIYMSVSPMVVFLQYRFGITAVTTPFGCRIMLFIIYSSSLISTLMLVCASLDRFFASSSSVSVRSFSNIQKAQRLIIIITILTLIYICPFIIIYYWNYTTNRCAQLSSPIIMIYLSSRIVIYYLLSPLAMTIFGLLTIHNIQNQLRRVAPINHINSRRRTESQLTRILIIQVAAYVFFSIPAAVTYILTTFIPSMNTTFINSIRSITLLWQQGTYVFATFLYILSGSIYREELKKLFKCNNYFEQRLRQVTARLRTYIEPNS